MAAINNCTRGVGFPELLHLTVPNDMDFLQAMGVFFSMLPVALMILFFFVFVFTRKLSFIILFSLGCLASAVNQFILKPMKEQHRPPESCLTDTDGFPSGHSVNALGVWAFIALQEIFNYRSSITRKVVLVTLYTAIFSLNGPARNVVKDHTWEQIFVGMGAGAVWGAVVWLFFRFIVQHFLLEKLMSTKFAHKLGLVNDLDPEYRHSKYHGARLVDSHHSQHYENLGLLNNGDIDATVRTRTMMTHCFSAVVHIVLGVFAFPAGLSHPICSKVLPGLLISIGCFTVGIGLAQGFVTVLCYRKLTGRSWFPLLLKSAMMLAGTLFFQSIFYCYLIVDSSRKDGCNTQQLDRATVYVIIWAAFELFLVIYWLVLCKLFHIPSLYSNKKVLPSNFSVNKYSDVKGYATI